MGLQRRYCSTFAHYRYRYVFFFATAAAEPVKEMSISNQESREVSKVASQPDVVSADRLPHHGSCDEYGCGSHRRPARRQGKQGLAGAGRRLLCC